jgi:peptide/nickel transport system permease protein
MGGYAIRRGVDGVITIWMVTLLIFLLLRVTGNPIEILAPPDTLPEDRQRLMSFYGLDKPVWQQYLNFVKGVFVGNFGVSLRWADQAAFDVGMQRLPATLQLSGTAFFFSVVLGVGIGCWRPPDPILWSTVRGRCWPSPASRCRYSGRPSC